MRYRYRNDDELKDSGVEWIGKVPKDWEVGKFKYSSLLYTGNSIKDNEKDNYTDSKNSYPYISTKDINIDYNTINYNNGMYTKTNDKTFKVANKDSILICIEGGSAGRKISYLNQNVSFVNKLCCIQSNKINSKYQYYYCNSDAFKTEFSLNMSGLIGGVSVSALNNFRLVNPNLFEQEKIANFLDEKSSQFDLIISKKEKLIERLEEAKKSLISEVVTGKVKVVKTDDGYELVKRSIEEMKDSGVEWLGKIPKDWEVKYFKHMFNFKKGLSITKADLKESGVPCVSYGEIHSKYRFELNPSKQNLQYVDEEYLSTGTSSLLEYGDFIFCDTSEDLNGCGNFTYLNEYSKVFAGYHTIIARANKEINYRYMAYLFDSNDWRFQIRSKVSGIKVFSITQSILKTTTVIQPYLIEQKHISDYLDIKCNGINHTIDKTKLQIEKLKEAKQSLISEAVTGKIEILD